MKLHATIQKTGMGIFAALLLACLPQWAVAQGNLVVNGGFDTDAAGWSQTNNGLGGYESKNGNPPGSFILDSLSPSLITDPTVSQTINNLISGIVYTISGDYTYLTDRGGGSATDSSFGVAMDGIFFV